jgi:sugar lactone lactonase YvrE/actin-like ATPase involved in cell morphogenesis
MEYSLGVDLGTTYSAAAVCRGGRVETCTLGATAPAIPSVVVLRADGDVLIGEVADRRSVSEPTRTAREFKRRLGDPTPIVLGGTPYGAEALMAHLLKGIVALVSEREGGPPARIVLTHPANFGPYKTGLLHEAARLAGLDLERVRYASEPEAAAVAYADAQRVEPGDVVAVYDFGGGTFDAAMVRKTEQGFELVGTPEGMERLGGIDIDAAVLAHVNDSLDGMLSELDTTDEITRTAVARLRDECRLAKEALSTDTDTAIPVSLPGLATEVRLTREELEGMIRPRLVETVDALQRAVASAGISMADVSRILLVGGTSRMPLVGQLVREASGRPVALDAHPKLAIACGAALLGAVDEEADAPVVAGAATAATPSSASGAGLAAGAAVGGAAFAGTVGTAAVLHELAGTPAAAAEAATPGGAATGHVGAAASPPTTPAASPPATPAASPPATPAASPPTTPTSIPRPAARSGATPNGAAHPAPTPAAAAARPTRRIAPLVAGGAAGIAAGAVVIAVLLGGGDDTKTEDAPVAAATATTSAESATTAPVAAAKPAQADGLVVEAVAGNGDYASSGGLGGPATAAGLDRPESVAVARNGDVYLTDNSSQRLLKVSDGVITLVHDGKGASNLFGLAIAPDDSVWFSNSNGVYKLTGSTATLVLDDQLTGDPFPLTFDRAGNLYIAATGAEKVAKYDTDGVLTFIAGNGVEASQAGGDGDGGPALAAPLGHPIAVAVDSKGNVYIAENFSERIRKVTPDGTISTVAGGGRIDIAEAPEGTPMTDIIFDTVDGVAVDEHDNIYVSDHQLGGIIRFGADGKLVRVAGLLGGAVEDGRSALTTKLFSPGRMGFDRDGNLYFVDSLRVRRIKGVA